MKKLFKGWNKFEITLLFIATIIICSLSIYWGDTWLGVITSVTGVICVILTAKGKLSCYIYGLINIIGYVIISYNQKFYGEVMLNALYYLPMQFIGFYMWKKNISEESLEVKARRLNRKNAIFTFTMSTLGVIGYGFILKGLGGNLPFIDSITTVLSVTAMYLSVKRYMEQWIMWIVIDVVSVIMWGIAMKNGSTDIATLLMWTTYLINAIYGYVKWNKDSKI